MTLSRAEAAAMRDSNLQVVVDGLRHRLRTDWARGQTGKLSDLYDLAVLTGEAAVRGYALKPPALPGQLELFPRSIV